VCVLYIGVASVLCVLRRWDGFFCVAPLSVSVPMSVSWEGGVGFDGMGLDGVLTQSVGGGRWPL
jgi:hypothetical protein